MKFKRGICPRRSLDIGMDSMDLWHHLPVRLENILNQNHAGFDYEVFSIGLDRIDICLDLRSMLVDINQTNIQGYLTLRIMKDFSLSANFRTYTSFAEVFEKSVGMHLASINIDYLNKTILKITRKLLDDADWGY